MFRLYIDSVEKITDFGLYWLRVLKSDHCTPPTHFCSLGVFPFPGRTNFFPPFCRSLAPGQSVTKTPHVKLSVWTRITPVLFSFHRDVKIPRATKLRGSLLCQLKKSQMQQYEKVNEILPGDIVIISCTCLSLICFFSFLFLSFGSSLEIR